MKRKEILIITDSASDVNESMNLKHTKILPLGFFLNGDDKEYRDNSGVVPFRLRQLLDLGVDAQTLPINYDDLLNMLLKAGEENMDVICIHVSENFSYSTREEFLKARDEVQLKYHDMAIAVIDSESISLGEGMLVLEADKLVDKNELSFEEIIANLYSLKTKLRFDLISKTDNSVIAKYHDYKFAKFIKENLGMDTVYTVGSFVKNKKLYKRGNNLELLVRGLYGQKEEVLGVVKTGVDEDLERAYEVLTHDSVIEADANCVNNINLGSKSIGVVYRKR